MTRRLWTLFDVACPYCGAGFDEKCKVVSGPGGGRPLTTFHVARRGAFAQAKTVEGLIRERV